MNDKLKVAVLAAIILIALVFVIMQVAKGCGSKTAPDTKGPGDKAGTMLTPGQMQDPVMGLKPKGEDQ